MINVKVFVSFKLLFVQVKRSMNHLDFKIPLFSLETSPTQSDIKSNSLLLPIIYHLSRMLRVTLGAIYVNHCANKAALLKPTVTYSIAGNKKGRKLMGRRFSLITG